MRRNAVRSLFSFTATNPHVPSRSYNNGGSIQNIWISPPSTHTTPSNLRSLFTNSQPPPEWIEPLTDVSELASETRDLVPSPWVSKILGVLDGSADMEANLNHFCKTFLIKLTPNFVSYVMKSPKLRRNPEVALRFFSWAGRQRRYNHQLECYVSLIEVLCLCGQTVDAARLCSSLKGKSFVMTASSVNSLVKSFGSVGMVEELLWVWRQMKENGIDPSLYTFNFLLNGLINSNNVEYAEEIFETMETGKVKPDIVTYNTIMKGYCKAGKFQAAMENLRAMEENNGQKVKPDKITYAILIQAYYSKEDFGSCLSLYHEMGEKGLEVPCHVYSLVIGGLCRAGKCVEAHAVFRDMIDKGSESNVATYTALIDSYAKIGQLGEAVKLFETMRKDGLDPDEITYGVIITGLCKNGRIDKAVGYFKQCREKGSVLYSILIDGLGKAGRVGEARNLFEEMGCARDSFCYNALIDAVAKSGEIDEAMGLFQRMEDEGVDQTVYTFTILFDGLFRKRRNEDALRLWDEMIEKGVTPTAASFRALANGLCLSGKVARACKILDELAPMGLVPETAFQDMINVLCKAGRIKEACKLADGIIERGRESSGKLRTIFINALRKSGNSVLAIKLMHSRIGIGYDRMGCFKKRINFRSLLEK